MMRELRRRFRDPQHFAHKVLERTSASLILVALGAAPLEPTDVPSGLQTAFFWIEIGIVGLFSAEYLLRLWIAEKRWRYVFSFYGIVDLLAIVPFYLLPGTETGAVRAVRLLRLLRMARLRGFDRALNQLGRALYDIRREAVIFLVASCVVFYIGAVGIYQFEKDAQPEDFGTFSKSLWWTLSFLLDFEYGEFWPQTFGGKAFAALVAFVGVGIVAVPAGIAGSVLIRIARDKENGTSDRDAG